MTKRANNDEAKGAKKQGGQADSPMAQQALETSIRYFAGMLGEYLAESNRQQARLNRLTTGIFWVLLATVIIGAINVSVAAAIFLWGMGVLNP